MQYLRIQVAGRTAYARASSPTEVELLSGAPWAGGSATGERHLRADTQLLAPAEPSKIICVGRNYAAHARELGNDVPSEPLIFLKPPSSLAAPGAPILLPRTSQRVEHEAEIGIVIGKRLKHASPTDALAAIFGVTCINDVTARDLQRKDVQFTRAKSFDTFCPVGPWIETECSLSDLSVIGRVNGQERQRGHVAQMAFSIATILSFISEIMTLEPGDLIATGTPEGVGPLVAGDTVEVEVTGVGVLVNQVAADALA